MILWRSHLVDFHVFCVNIESFFLSFFFGFKCYIIEIKLNKKRKKEKYAK
jgi:hypothetical protein